MGTINYFTSDYITLGLQPYDADEFIDDEGTIDYDLISIYYDDDYHNIKNELEKYSFYYYHVTIKPGYYEGFTIDIENNFSIAFDGYEDKKEANKEITQIKHFLIGCAGLGMVQCFPGWCTGYSDYKSTIKAINEAIKIMREEVKTIPTWTQYNKGA